MIYAYKTPKAWGKRLFLNVVGFHFNRIWLIYTSLPYKIYFTLCLATPETNIIGPFILFAKLTENEVFQDTPTVCSLVQGGKIVKHPIP